ncbi:hypothetical protein EGX98_06020 [Fusobacterium necrophorum]|uniref:Transposase IS30-like HTH domain-containing protein n=2 Tax=Fusobacterium necrophorum TaxID=859 RepID=A0AB73BVM9_9FUSO|nr:hypothetical protein [Fusobacterium necrophorum]AYZ73612.1 hypothetical protein EGX98_06020 [Fusobacterium necrophorum]AZW08386.1 hypothetical protein EO219_01360 [Fusobacterium necrophorum subsp. necrophorum]KDE61665.1 hypothetical protein FUSO5_11240 [Fusobacterium necrophorum BFTR-1]KDE62561.1 hypothetical protein FUSO3_07560 [Fusobacterium necrophorum BL]KDE66188.1 hypothetical protein FUSO6_12480 [Fusobacterium necrophorum DAB]
MGLSKIEIALRIGINRGSIQREIQRGWISGLLTSELDTYDTYCCANSPKKISRKSKKKIEKFIRKKGDEA